MRDLPGHGAAVESAPWSPDGDGVQDAIDPTPTNPGVPGNYIEGALRVEAEFFVQIQLALIDAPNNNAAAGRRNALSNKLTSAANKVAEGNIQGATADLTDPLEKIDGVTPPPDRMADGPDKNALRAEVELLIVLLGLL